MMTGGAAGKLSAFITIAAILLGVLIQIQMSVMTGSGGYLGLRVNLADLLLPFAGVAVLVSLLQQKSRWPEWGLSAAWLWVAALSILMTAAFFHGYFVTGAWSRWALANKFIGWFILMAYFCLGGWLAANGGTMARERFIQGLIAAFCLIGAGSLAVLYLADLGILATLPFKAYPLAGLMGNRNAFALLTVTVFCAAIFSAPPQSRILPIIAVLLAFLIVEIGSRTGLIVFCAAFFALAILRPQQIFRRILPGIVAGAMLVTAVHGMTGKPMLREKQISQTLAAARMLQQGPAAELSEVALKKRGETVRLRVINDALALWREHPVFGAGLGTFLTESYKKYEGTDTIVDLIDCTPLWLLTETGLVGLLLFGGFYGAVLWALWRRRKDDPWALAMLLILILFAVMALAHEILFTRYIWLLLGLSLGVSPNPLPR